MEERRVPEVCLQCLCGSWRAFYFHRQEAVIRKPCFRRPMSYNFFFLHCGLDSPSVGLAVHLSFDLYCVYKLIKITKTVTRLDKILWLSVTNPRYKDPANLSVKLHVYFSSCYTHFGEIIISSFNCVLRSKPYEHCRVAIVFLVQTAVFRWPIPT